ncbi:MAG: glutamine synthetase, partial [Pseudomonadota bacterium]
MTGAVASGWLAQRGLLSAEACEQAEQCIENVALQQTETVRVVFADQHGVLRGKTVTAERLRSVFLSGLRVPSTLLLKDTSHRTVFPVWQADGDAPMHNAGDVLLVPQPDTWVNALGSAHAALVHCDVVSLAGDPFAFASRSVLQRQVDRLAVRGLDAVFGLEVEFQIYQRNDTGVIAPLNSGMQYLTDARYTDAEPVLDAIRRAAVAAHLPVQSVEVEMGPGQFEFTFAAGDPMAIADMAVNFRTLVSAVCKSEGVLASFMAKPCVPGALGNGWHIHQSVVSTADGTNRFMPAEDATLSPLASAWVGG